MKYNIIFLLFIFAGCPMFMGNKDIVKEVKYCHDNGMEAKLIQSNEYDRVTAVVCFPSKVDCKIKQK